MEVKTYTCECRRCGYTWVPRIPSPKVCPHCKQYNWYKDSTRSQIFRVAEGSGKEIPPHPLEEIYDQVALIEQAVEDEPLVPTEVPEPILGELPPGQSLQESFPETSLPPEVAPAENTSTAESPKGEAPRQDPSEGYIPGLEYSI